MGVKDKGSGRGRGGQREPWQKDKAQDGGISPALLTSYIKQARTLHALFETFLKHQRNLNHIHLSACWSSLGQLAPAAKPRWDQEHAAALQTLQKATLSVVAAQEAQARQLVNIAHGAARSGVGGTLQRLFKALAHSLKGRLSDCKSQELANAAWAFAKAGYVESAFFVALAKTAQARSGEFNAQELANMAWAFATCGHADAKLFSVLAHAVQKCLGDFSAQGMANAVWAFARAGHVDAQLFGAVAGAARDRLEEFNAQDLAHTACAFAKAGQPDTQLFEALARSAERRLRDFSPQGLANTAWAFAKAGQPDPQLFAALARAVEGRLREFNAQDLANAAWAFAKVCHPDASLLAALARAAEERVADFNPQDLGNTAWAFAKLGQLDGRLFAALAQRVQGSLTDFGAQDLAKAAWAFAKVGQLEGALLNSLARCIERRIEEFTAQDLASTAWVFANSGHMEPLLFTALATSLEKCLGDLGEEELDNAAWAFGKAGQQGIAKRLRQRKDSPPVTQNLHPVDACRCGRIVVAGGGIGGAAIALALQSRGFEVLVLEADVSFDARKQGYGLTIQSLDAVHALGLSLETVDAPATSHYVFDSQGHILGIYGEAFQPRRDRHGPPAGAGRFVHISRQMLRQKIVDQVHPDTIRWNSKLKHFSVENPQGGLSVVLTDGTTLEATLLVGADGIYSTVRRQMRLPGDRLSYLGFVVVLGMVASTSIEGSGQEGSAWSLTQRRIFETVDGVTRIYAMPFNADVTMWQLSFPFNEAAARSLVRDPAALKAEILSRCGSWHDPIPALLRATPLDAMSGYPIYDRDPLDPEVLRGSRAQQRVTLMGDAAHPMAPFKAQGANQALRDAVLLAETLQECLQSQAGLDAALPLFERRMLSRSAKMVLASREKARELHSALAMQPARKVQRESGLDMPTVIRALRSRGVGAHSAADPRGLDAVVTEVIENSGLGDGEVKMKRVQPEGMEGIGHEALQADKRTKRRRAASADAEAREDGDTETKEKSPRGRREAAAGSADKTQRGRAKAAEPNCGKVARRTTLQAGVDTGWWKGLVFDGYTGEQWEAWYS